MPRGHPQVGAADLSVERAMRSGEEEVCIALLGKVLPRVVHRPLLVPAAEAQTAEEPVPSATSLSADPGLGVTPQDGSKTADLQLALRFTAGSVTAGLAALAAAPPPSPATSAAGAQLPQPLPPAPRPPAPPAVRGPLETGAHGLTPRPRSAEPHACAGARGRSPDAAQAHRQSPRAAHSYPKAATASARPPQQPAGDQPAGARAYPDLAQGTRRGADPAPERAGGSFSNHFSTAALRTWANGQRVGDGAAAPDPRFPDLAPERSAASQGQPRAQAPRPGRAGGGWGAEGAARPRSARECCGASAAAAPEAPSAPPAPAELLAQLAAAAPPWQGHRQAPREQAAAFPPGARTQSLGGQASADGGRGQAGAASPTQGLLAGAGRAYGAGSGGAGLYPVLAGAGPPRDRAGVSYPALAGAVVARGAGPAAGALGMRAYPQLPLGQGAAPAGAAAAYGAVKPTQGGVTRLAAYPAVC